jgi:xanthine dehydrogenase YagS FAD-binding subunit
MTHPFLYRRATSLDDAVHQLDQPGAVSLGGGTDLLATIAEELARPDVLVDLRTIPDSTAVHATAEGGVRIGASALIADISSHPLVRDRYAALAEACDVVGSPALRHMGTIGGNLCQRPRCWYFRRGVPCLKNGGSACPAVDGENQYLAILDGGPCYVVHPSDPAVALTALDAVVEVASVRGSRTVAMADFYVLPSERLDRETVLEPGEVVVAVVLPPGAAGGIQQYRKLIQREAWDFALVSVAGCRREDGEVRLVCGGVAPRPWRVNSSVEEDVASGGLDDDTIATLVDRALLDAEPLSRNAYKVDMAAALLRRTISSLA